MREAEPDRGSRGGPRITRVQLGCGPENALSGWWNVDIRPFDGVDQVLDATQPWPFQDLEYVYSEHFIEHLAIDDAFAMLGHAWRSVRAGGTIRLSTPALEWVLASHFDAGEQQPERRIDYTFMMNRAFHGWGHQFLYSRDLLEQILRRGGWEKLRFCGYGESENADLAGLERHGNLEVHAGLPSVWIVEADRATQRDESEVDEYARHLEDAYVKYVRGGH